MSVDIRTLIRDVPDFPKRGIIFKDITTILKNPEGLKTTANQLFEFAKEKGITKVIGIESRGFIIGGYLAAKLNAGFVPIRKVGKLPAEKERETYQLEYGVDTIEIHKDAISKGDKVLIHDDLLATGGTAVAACRLVERLGGEISQISFIIELNFLKGRDKLNNYDVRSLVQYDAE